MSTTVTPKGIVELVSLIQSSDAEAIATALLWDQEASQLDALPSLIAFLLPSTSDPFTDRIGYYLCIEESSRIDPLPATCRQRYIDTVAILKTEFKNVSVLDYFITTSAYSSLSQNLLDDTVVPLKGTKRSYMHAIQQDQPFGRGLDDDGQAYSSAKKVKTDTSIRSSSKQASTGDFASPNLLQTAAEPRVLQATDETSGFEATPVVRPTANEISKTVSAPLHSPKLPSAPDFDPRGFEWSSSHTPKPKATRSERSFVGQSSRTPYGQAMGPMYGPTPPLLPDPSKVAAAERIGRAIGSIVAKWKGDWTPMQHCMHRAHKTIVTAKSNGYVVFEECPRCDKRAEDGAAKKETIKFCDRCGFYACNKCWNGVSAHHSRTHAKGAH